MLKIRIIPILTFNGFALVKTKQFKNPRMLGNPVQAARIYNSRGVDELLFLDIFATQQKRKINLKIVNDVIRECFMPVGIGGGIETLEDINDLLQVGADKVIIKSSAINNVSFIREASNFFGSQCISISVDVKRINNKYLVQGQNDILIDLESFLNKIQENGAGEVILTSIDNDGMMHGYDIQLYNQVHNLCQIPIVFSGGGGNLEHFSELFSSTDCNAVGASSIYHFTQFTPLDVKNVISKHRVNVRFCD